MNIRKNFVNIRMPIIRLFRSTSDFNQRYLIADNVSVGSVVMTRNCYDIGLVADVFNGKPTKIFARVSGHETNGEISQYGGINTISWYDTGVHMSVENWVCLSSKTDAKGFYEYWKSKLRIKG